MITIQKGDIVLVHSTSFLAKGIQVFMNITRWTQGKFKPFYDKGITNHIGMGYGNNMIIEAVKDGVVPEEINKSYEGHTGTVITIYRYPWSDIQLDSMDDTFAKLKGKPYQFTNFLSYIVNIFSFNTIWLDHGKSVTDREYCSEVAGTAMYRATDTEVAATVLDIVTHDYFKKYWRTSPYKVETWCKKYCVLVSKTVI